MFAALPPLHGLGYALDNHDTRRRESHWLGLHGNAGKILNVFLDSLTLLRSHFKEIMIHLTLQCLVITLFFALI